MWSCSKQKKSPLGELEPYLVNKNTMTSIQSGQNYSEDTLMSLSDLVFNPLDWSIKDFQIGMKVGSGGFGKVYLARTRKDHFICAIKMLPLNSLKNPKAAKLVMREIEIQSSLSHKNIVQLYGFFSDNKNFYIITEYLPDGDLFSHLNRQVKI